MQNSVALSILNKSGVNALVRHCLAAGMEKGEILQHYRQAVIDYEKRNGREVSSYYVLGDAIEKEIQSKDFHTVAAYYKKERKAGFTAKDAIGIARHKVAMEKWKNEVVNERNFFTDSNNIAAQFWHEGLRYTFKIENEEENHDWYDLVSKNMQKVNAQGYYCTTSRHGASDEDNKRYSGGNSIDFIHSVSDVHFNISLPRSFFEQYYDPKLGKHEAHTQMIQRAISSVQSELNNLCGDWCVASIAVENSEGEEIVSDSLGMCDSDYCTSGEVFFEQLWPNIQHLIAEYREAQNVMIAQAIEASRPDLQPCY